jgi:pSer/pThr/pTyr-binding forkhead associated (FHA) protein
MKIRLVVASGSAKGKAIPVTISPFLIGRDPVCQLRPASALVSNRHCTIWQCGGAVYVQDMQSTNGTFVNGERITAERAIQNGDRLQVGPLLFDVLIETSVSVNEPTPTSLPKVPAQILDPEDAAAKILFDDEARAPSPSGAGVDATGVPEGPTAMGILAPPPAEEPSQDADKKAKAATNQKAKEDTATAADAILKRYMRRPKK